MILTGCVLEWCLPDFTLPLGDTAAYGVEDEPEAGIEVGAAFLVSCCILSLEEPSYEYRLEDAGRKSA